MSLCSPSACGQVAHYPGVDLCTGRERQACGGDGGRWSWGRLVPVEDRGDLVAERVGVDADRTERVVERERVGVTAPGLTSSRLR